MEQLIDTSVWVEYLRRSGSPAIKRTIDRHIEAEEATYTCPIVYELLSGAREHEEDDVYKALSYCKRHTFHVSYWEGSAKLAQKLFRKGITVSPGDVQIAFVAMELELPLICKDKHFSYMRKVVGNALQIVQIA